MTAEQLTIVDFNRTTYKDLCKKMKKLLTKEKELEATKEEIRKQLILMANGDRMEYGIKVQYRTAKGTVDYKELTARLYPEKEIREQVLDEYRKPCRAWWEVKSY